MAAFKSMGNRATVDDLSKCIAQSIHRTEDYVRSEVANVLNRGVDDGFLLKRGQFYVLVGKDNYQVDHDERRAAPQADELAELKERQKLRNELEISLYSMSIDELRRLHSTYVRKDNN